MVTRHETFRFAKVPSTDAQEAYLFHIHVSVTNPYIWPRKETEIQKYAKQGSLFSVRRMNVGGEFVGIVYTVLDEKTATWEVGGLTVDSSVQRRGIGTLMVRFALAHTMVFEQPWNNRQKVVAHVHEDNNDPRSLLEKLGFEFYQRIEVPSHDAPCSMRRNSAGNVVGDEFQFTLDGLRKLSAWFNEEFDGTLVNGNDAVEFDLGPSNIEYLKETLREMVREGSN